jgi:D-alanyl-D-alanine carboxypeptidase/D-alanyl-D-alanine-endopeptidase (penicillin-binding protein 4)
MTALLTRRAPFVRAGVPRIHAGSRDRGMRTPDLAWSCGATERAGRTYLLLISVLSIWAAIASPRVGFAQTNTPAAGASVHAAARSKQERSDIARFGDRVQAALASTGNDKAYWGLMISDADTGDVLYSLNAGRYFMPASNAKLFTTAMALATLGPDFHIRTTAESAGEPDPSGRLAGDLVLVGRGDANLSNRVFPFLEHAEHSGPPEKALADLADQVLASGVKEISGDIIADDSYFAPERYPPGWGIDDAVWSYGAAVSALAINDNFISVDLRPGATIGAPLVYSAAPWPGIYGIRNETLTTAAGTEPKLRLERDPDSQIFHLSGTLPLDAPARELQLAVPQPAEHAAAILMQLLEARGVRVEGHSRARHGDRGTQPQAASPLRVLAELTSPTLLQDVLLTNKLSMNLHAELLLRVAAREKAGATTMDDALAFATQFRQSMGIAPDDVQLTDGSGLSRGDLVTPQSVVQLLAYALRQPWGTDFLTTLPVAGQDGTLENRMRGTAAAGQVHAKTGLVEHVNSLSGYATSRRGAHLIFSIFGNNTGTHGRDGINVVDSICVAMVEELAPHLKTGAAHPGINRRPAPSKQAQ